MIQTISRKRYTFFKEKSTIIVEALRKGDLMDQDLYMAMKALFEEVEIPESTDKACEQMIQEYIQREKDRKGEKE